MKLSVLKIVFASALLAVAGVAAQAQVLKIGYVNSDRVLRDSAPAKAAQAKLEAEFGRRERELNDAALRLKNAADKLDKDLPTLSESERNRRQRELVDQDREIQRNRREFQEDLNQRKNEELAAIVDRANRVIKQIFETEKFDLIIQDAITDSTGRPLVSARVDITKKVIDALNNGK